MSVEEKAMDRVVGIGSRGMVNRAQSDCPMYA